jgi:hypothetical protein
VNPAPRLLFVPASGAQGAGEYYRCVAIASTAQARWPDTQIRFIVNGEARYAASSPFPTVLVQGSPTYNNVAVTQVIDEFAPQVVVFDSAGRVAQFARARRARAATVYVSSRFKTRWKGFRLRRMRVMDQHWLAWPRFLEGSLTRWEQFKLRLMGRPEIVFLDPVHERPDATRAAELRRRLGIGADPYLLFSAGGGGYERTGMPAPEIFARAAIDVQGAAGMKAVWVKGPNYESTSFDAAGLVALGALRADEMIDLLAGAQLAVVNGGSLLLQALALRVPTIAAPVAGDQPARIAACERQGVAIGTALDPAALAASALALLRDPSRLERLRVRTRELNLGNGSEQAVDAIARLLAR